MKKRVVIHTHDGQTLRGVLLASYRDCHALAHAEHIEEDVQELQGTVLVPRAAVSFVQVLG